MHYSQNIAIPHMRDAGVEQRHHNIGEDKGMGAAILEAYHGEQYGNDARHHDHQ